MINQYLAIVDAITVLGLTAQTCIPRYYEEGSSFVCVCNSTYCDTAPSAEIPLQSGQGLVISSGQTKDRFSKTIIQFGSQQPPAGSSTSLLH